MNCPRCKNELVPEQMRGIGASISVDVCNQCQGIWFDRHELSRIDKITETVAVEFRKIPSGVDQLKPLGCPRCGQEHTMQKALHPRDENVVIDFCVRCGGIWLDKGELEAIQKESVMVSVRRLLKYLGSDD